MLGRVALLLCVLVAGCSKSNPPLPAPQDAPLTPALKEVEAKEGKTIALPPASDPQ